MYEAWTDQGSVSVENVKCVEPKTTVTYDSGQTHTVVSAAPQN